MKGILLIGHGSRYKYNEELLELQAQRLREKGYKNVYVAYNETSKPLIGEMMEKIAADGVKKLVALPFFIASGIHFEKDIPRSIGIGEGNTKGVVKIGGKEIDVVFETPFGKDPVLAKAVYKKLSQFAPEGRKVGFLVVGHGSRLPYNKETIDHHASELSKMGLGDVRGAFNEFNEPSIEDTMEALAKDGAEEIVVFPLFMALGDHIKNDIPPKIGLEKGAKEGKAKFAGKEVFVRYIGPIGSDPMLTDVLVEKIKRNL
ncbi:MAG: hypothetical protein GX224_02095 [Thermoplasmatales archaeon]|nr:hypothetical protein [Thermoplasmatales archaeon]